MSAVSTSETGVRPVGVIPAAVPLLPAVPGHDRRHER